MEQETNQPNITQTVTQTSIEKKSKAPAVISVLCVIFALAGIGFGVYGMFFHKPATPSTTNTNSGNDIAKKETPSAETLSSLLKTKYNLFDENGFTYHGWSLISDYVYDKDAEGFDELAKLVLIIHDNYRDYSEDAYDKCDDGDGGCYKTISYSELNEKYHTYFGNTNDLEKKDYTNNFIMLGVTNIKYDSTTDSFEVEFPWGLGGRAASAGYYTKVANVKAADDGFVATAIVTYVDADNVDIIGGHTDDGCDPEWKCVEVDMDTLKVDSALYDYSFIEEDGAYKLTSITKQ